ncbi:MAG: outer membrane lipoprotein-sorting protein [bacterium]
MKKIITLALSLTLALFISVHAETRGEEIIAKSQEAFYYQGKNLKARVSMNLVNKEGKTRGRKLIMLRKNFGSGEQKYFIYFEMPQDVRGMTFMVHKLPEKDDLRWLFIPALKMVRRIAASDRRSSFVGSDFTYEDVSGRDINADKHTLKKEDKLNGMDCYVIESVPNEKDEFSRKISWIDKNNYLPRQEEYYNTQGELYRSFNAVEIKDIDGFPTVTKRTVKDIKTGHYTEVVFDFIKYNIDIEDTLFEERFMQNPPRRLLE